MQEWMFYPLSTFSAIIIAHIIKEIIYIWKHKTFSLHTLFFETGGMPSAHSAGIIALTTTLFYLEGISEPTFWIGVFFSAVVLRDAFGVRRAVGEQAQLLNILSKQLKLEEKVHLVLGHTPLQVTMGALLGFGVSNFWLWFL